jgi:hypothetical protein
MRVGEVTFDDANGRHTISVHTDGEFWPVVSIWMPRAGIKPEAARELASLLLIAADQTEAEFAERVAYEDHEGHDDRASNPDCRWCHR